MGWVIDGEAGLCGIRKIRALYIMSFERVQATGTFTSQSYRHYLSHAGSTGDSRSAGQLCDQ